MAILSASRFAISKVTSPTTSTTAALPAPAPAPTGAVSPTVATSIAPAATLILQHKSALLDPLMTRLMASAATPGWEPAPLDIVMAASEDWHWDETARQWYYWDGTGPNPRATPDGAASSVAAHDAAGDVASISPDPGTTADPSSDVSLELNGHLASRAEVRAFYVKYYNAMGGSA